MNSAEVVRLLHGSMKSFADPSCVRPSETQRTCEVRQLITIRDLFDQLRRFTDDLTFRQHCLDFAERFLDLGFPRAAFHSCLKCYWADVEESPVPEDASNNLAVLTCRIRSQFFTALSRIGMCLCEGVERFVHWNTLVTGWLCHAVCPSSD